MAKLAFNRIIQELDGDAAPYAGAKLFTYQAGSSTKETTYQDAGGTTAHANPIVLDANGRLTAGVYLTEGQAYKFVLAPSDDTDPPASPIWTLDDIEGINDASVSVTEWQASNLAPTFVSGTSFTLTGDQTSTFHVGRRLKITDSGGTKYATIRTTAFTTVTTVTVDVDSAGSLASPTSAVSYGILAATNRSIPAGFVTPAQITANQNNYAPSGTAVDFRVSSDARRNITGWAGGTDGREITVHNVGTFPILFKYEDSSSTAANRLAFGHTLSGGHSLTMKYDGTSARWRCTFREIPAGTILPFGGSTVPEGYLARDGSNVSRTTYASLFNEVGTTWGVGDGSTTFGVGDDRRRTWVGSGGSGTATLANSVGSTGGAETHTLVTGEIPAHTHTSHSHAENSKGNDSTAQGGDEEASAETSGSTGGGGAHNNMQPSAVVTSIIKY